MLRSAFVLQLNALESALNRAKTHFLGTRSPLQTGTRFARQVSRDFELPSPVFLERMLLSMLSITKSTIEACSLVIVKFA